MGKISEIIKVNSVLGSEVNLIEELFDVEKNRKRMANYMPTKGHRDAFEKIIKGLYELQDKRAYILNGSYGTGKSNLLLMIANYLMNNSDSEAMKSFFSNYILREEDEKIGDYDSEEEVETKKREIETSVNRLKSLRKTDKPHFVALCKYDISGDFTEILLRAINEAFIRENLPVDKFDSIYQEAIRRINLWEEKRKSFYEELEEALEQEKSWTVDDLKNKLIYIDSEALEIFKKIYKNITLTDFSYLKDNLADIIEEIVSSEFFREKYSGFTIFFDEFGNILKNHNFNELIFQRFSEFCQNSLNEKNIPVIFIATTHKSFNSYSEYYAKDEFKKVSDRFNDVSLSTEGFENIISVIVHPLKETELWKKYIKKSKLIKLSKKITALDLFRNLKGNKLTEKLIENLYPMHPIATYSLLEISKEVSSNNRSVYSFFVRGEFENYIKETELEEELKFYTAERLIDYFGREKFISSSTELRNEHKDKIRNYEASKTAFEKIKSKIHEEKEKELSNRILDIILIYDLLNIPTDEDTIIFGLNLNLEETNILKKIMKFLVDKGVIYFKELDCIYEFRQSNILNIDGIISEYVNTNLSKPIDIIAELKELAKERDYLGIKKEVENLTEVISTKPEFKVENYYQKDIISIKELESENFILSKSKKLHSENILNYSVDGYYYYILCETNSERERALKVVKNIEENNLIFAIPQEVKELKKSLLTLLAIKNSEKLKDLKQQEIQILSSYQRRAIQYIVTTLKNIFKIENILLFYLGKEYREEGRNKDKDLITEVFRNKHLKNLPSIDLSFKQRKGEFNSEKEKNFKKFIDSFLYVNTTLQFEKNMTILKEYLKPFIDSEIILENGNDSYKININLECYNVYPALKNTLEILDKEELILGEFKKELVQKYALGKYAAYFIIAFVYRYYNGNLSLIKKGVNVSINSYEDLKSFVETGETIRCIKISENEKEFIGNLDKIFKKQTTLAKKGNIKETFITIKEWYNSLEKYQKIELVVEKNIISCFEKINKLSADEFLLSELNILIGKEKNDFLSKEEFNKIILKIKNFKKAVEDSNNIIYSEILKKLNILFQNENLYIFFNEYYKNLPDFKKDITFKIYQKSDPRNFLQFLENLNEGEELEELLLNYKTSLGNYKNWEEDFTDEIIKSIQKGYEEIESSYLIPKPELEYIGKYEVLGSYIYFEEGLKIRIKNLSKEYDTYYTLEKIPLKVEEAFGDVKLKTATSDYIMVSEGDFFYCLNQQDGKGNNKRRSEEIEIKFRKKENKFIPEIQENKQEQIKLGEKAKENSTKIVFNIIPKRKEELKASIKGLITSVKEEISLSNKDIKDILEQLISEYSKGE